MRNIWPKIKLVLIFSYDTQQFLNENEEIFKLFDSICIPIVKVSRQDNIKIYSSFFTRI